MNKIALTFTILLIWSLSFAAKDYNVLKFGAVADGLTLNTIAIQKAIDKAHKKGGGRIIFPAGKFLTGSIILKSNVTLHLEENAILLGSTEVSQYQKIYKWMGLILADHSKNIGITGQGTIDGQGRALALGIDSLFYAGQLDSIHYSLKDKRPIEIARPLIIEFYECENIKITGINIQNGACWIQRYARCRNLLIDKIRVISDAYWNNDGMDIVDSKNVRITNCYVDTGDDGICLKSVQRGQYFCDSIYIANCTVRSSASAIKLGTISYGGFRNVVIENIKVFDTFRSAIAIESVDGGIIENVRIENITATNTGNAIFVRLGERRKKWPTGEIKNVLLKNIRVDVCFERPDYAYDMRGPALPFFHNIFPISITGVPDHIIENIRLENIEITYPGRGNKAMAYAPLHRLDDIPEEVRAYPEFSMFGELPAWGFYVRHVTDFSMKNVSIKIKEADYRPAMVFDDVKKVEIEGLVIEGDDKVEPIILKAVQNSNIKFKK